MVLTIALKITKRLGEEWIKTEISLTLHTVLSVIILSIFQILI
ncbi:protein of unknown function [Candidatus Nitrosocosmicus franklandus]|uniref:Uncharacterized protein n=1 Tax=Candidatus Nitrosocosmicus franklandianus TaxID=1798806 RepID=A0A484IHR2_9ARCH|nr:protein of unknown function [Candidatus Nitrosocosmicus franklandus]